MYSSSSSEGASSSSGELERRVREVTRQKEEEAARAEARVRREWEERLAKEKQAVKEALGGSTCPISNNLNAP